MTAAIIGVGNLAKSVARHLVDGEERVVLATRDEQNATALAKELGGLASAASVEKAITEADVVVFAVWFDTLKDLSVQHADLLGGRVVSIPPTRSRRTPTAGWFGRFPTAGPRALSWPGCSPPRRSS
jgi:8-hydroxy-5-deazaflavin:NADPH oxidoreductase